VAEPLVFYRVGAQAFKRRGGAALFRSELRLQREFRRRRFTSTAEFVRNVLVRGGYRLIPWRFRRAVYRPIVARYSQRPGKDLATLAPGEPSEPKYAAGDEYPEVSEHPVNGEYSQLSASRAGPGAGPRPAASQPPVSP
jgi:hypothetical protein